MRGSVISLRVGFIATLCCFLIALCPSKPARSAVVQPVFNSSDFSPGAPIDNPFFPLIPGTRFRYQGTVVDPDTGETADEVEEDFVTNQTVTLGGVPARVVHNTVTDDGELVEDTKDYYAQDKSGNVWYLGEDSTAFERDDKGNVISTDTSGSWHTGVHGAEPGFIMPANPTVGFAYAQENAPQDQAQDQAQVTSLSESVTVPFGSFTNVLKTIETSPLEPTDVEAKLYAKGLGEIQDLESINAKGVPLDHLDLVSATTSSPTSIPLPSGAWSGIATLAALATAGAGWAACQRASARAAC